MNRFDMAQEIARRVPLLAERDKDQWRRAEQLRARFVADYPPARISNLALDDYVIGKGKLNRSFCYRIEREMDVLGKIVGATSLKFGVYYGRTKGDASVKYRFAQHWGRNLQEAFVAVKQGIAELLHVADQDDQPALAQSRVSPMFKGKLLFLYHPERYAPIYDKRHLAFFVAKLDLAGDFRCEADMQRALMSYRATWPELMEQPPALFMHFLYEVFGGPPKPSPLTPEQSVEPLLPEALAGASFLSQLPPSPVDPSSPAGAAAGKHDFSKREQQTKRIGDRGEALVLALEKQRLKKGGAPQLAAKIRHVSQENDGAGFDILSYDEDGTERPIEVKATTGCNLSRGFYITSNEVEQSRAHPNYHIYFVFSAMSRQPRVFALRKPQLDGADFQLRPVAYHATRTASVTDT